MGEKQLSKEHHGREYIIGGLGAIAEYLALRYGMNWLAWLAAFLLWLAVVEYTRRWASTNAWIYVIWVGLFLAMGATTYYLIRPKAALVAVNTQMPTVQQTLPPIQQPPSEANISKPKIKTAPAKSSPTPAQPKQTTTGNSNGQVGGGVSTGPCSNVQLGGSLNQQTTNCNFDAPRKIRWKETGETSDSASSRTLRVWVDKAYPDAKFAVICDRPCEAVTGELDYGGREPKVRSQPEVYTGKVNGDNGQEVPNMAAFIVDHPVFGTDLTLVATVKSSDGSPFKIKYVAQLTVTGKR